MRQRRLLVWLLPFVLVAIGSACGGEEEPTKPDRRVASITITPQSAKITEERGTQDFDATVKDQNGDVMPHISLQWRVSNPDVATIDQNGTATAIFDGSTKVTVSAQGREASAALTVDLPNKERAMVGSEGDTLTLDSGVRLTIPPKAVRTETEVRIHESDPPQRLTSTDNFSTASQAVTLKPEGLELDSAAVLSIPSPTDGNNDSERVSIYRFSKDGKFAFRRPTRLTSDRSLATTPLTHFSEYGIIIPIKSDLPEGRHSYTVNLSLLPIADENNRSRVKNDVRRSINQWETFLPDHDFVATSKDDPDLEIVVGTTPKLSAFGFYGEAGWLLGPDSHRVIVLNKKYTWLTTEKIRSDLGAPVPHDYVWEDHAPLQQVMSHEFGHILGLEHPNVIECAVKTITPFEAGDECRQPPLMGAAPQHYEPAYTVRCPDLTSLQDEYDLSSDVEDRCPHLIEVVRGKNTTVSVGELVSPAPKLRVVGRDGEGVEGVTVVFYRDIQSPPGVTPNEAVRTTNKDGEVVLNDWTAYDEPGEYSIFAEASPIDSVKLNIEVTAVGEIEVSVSTTGADLDPDGYEVVVDGPVTRSKELNIDGSVTFSDLETGEYDVTLNDVADNCGTKDGESRSVDVQADQTTSVNFEVECSEKTGTLKVSVSTSGEDIDPDGYEIVVDGPETKTQEVDVDGSASFTLEPGDYDVLLEEDPDNCTPENGETRSVTVDANESTSVSYDVECTGKTGSLKVSASTSGDDPDSDGYKVTIDGPESREESIGTDGSVTFSDLSTGEYDVTLSDLADNCETENGDSRTVDVDANEETSVSYQISCKTTDTTLPDGPIDPFEDGTLRDVWTISRDDPNATGTVDQTRPRFGNYGYHATVGDNRDAHFAVHHDFNQVQEATRFTLWVYPDPTSNTFHYTLKSPEGSGSAGLHIGPDGDIRYGTDKVRKNVLVPGYDGGKWYKLEIGLFPSRNEVRFRAEDRSGNEWTDTGVPATVDFTRVKMSVTDYNLNYEIWTDNVTYRPGQDISSDQGTIEVTTSTTGSNIPDDYGLLIEGPEREEEIIGPNETLTFNLQAGDYEVSLGENADAEDESELCDPQSQNPKTVSVNPGETTSVLFEVECGGAADGLVYVTNAGSDNLSVIDGASSSVMTTISVGDAPVSVKFRPDGRRAWVTNAGSNSVSVIDVPDNSIAFGFEVDSVPTDVAFVDDGTKAYVVNWGADNMSVVDFAADPSSGVVTGTIPFEGFATNPEHIAVTENGSRAYVVLTRVDNCPVDATCFPGTAEIDASSDSVTNIISHEPPTGPIAVTPDGNTAYVSLDTEEGRIRILDLISEEASTIPVGNFPEGVAFTPDGNTAYVANSGSDNVSVIDVASKSVTTTISVGRNPAGVAITPDGSTVYVTNWDSGDVSVIDVASNSVIATIPVGENPYGVDVRPE